MTEKHKIKNKQIALMASINTLWLTSMELLIEALHECNSKEIGDLTFLELDDKTELHHIDIFTKTYGIIENGEVKNLTFDAFSLSEIQEILAKILIIWKIQH